MTPLVVAALLIAGLGLSLIDLVHGLKVWGDAGVYQRALLKFGRDYADFVERAQAESETGQHTVARELLHSFKGVAANLGIRELPALAHQLEGVVKNRRQPAASDWVTFADLVQQLWQQLESIPSQQSTAIAPHAPLVAVDPSPCLKRLILALENSDLDDESATALAQILPPDQFEPLKNCLESFEFAPALDLARALLAEAAKTFPEARS